MAQILAEFPVKEYPWHIWLDGQPRCLKRYEDFQTDPESMRVTVYRAAARRNVKVRTLIEGDSLVICVKEETD